jgi:hypothetical protein
MDNVSLQSFLDGLTQESFKETPSLEGIPSHLFSILLEKLLELPDLKKVLTTVPPFILYHLLVEEGWEQSHEWIRSLRGPQLQSLWDLDVWESDFSLGEERLKISRVAEWVALWLQQDHRIPMKRLEELDEELRILILNEAFHIIPVGISEEFKNLEDNPDYFKTLDGRFFIKVKDESHSDIWWDFLKSLYYTDINYAGSLLAYGAMSVMNEVQDMALQWRNSRMMDEGFVTPGEAKQILRIRRKEEILAWMEQSFKRDQAFYEHTVAPKDTAQLPIIQEYTKVLLFLPNSQQIEKEERFPWEDVWNSFSPQWDYGIKSHLIRLSHVLFSLVYNGKKWDSALLSLCVNTTKSYIHLGYEIWIKETLQKDTEALVKETCHYESKESIVNAFEKMGLEGFFHLGWNALRQLQMDIVKDTGEDKENSVYVWIKKYQFKKVRTYFKNKLKLIDKISSEDEKMFTGLYSPLPFYSSRKPFESIWEIEDVRKKLKNLLGELVGGPHESGKN